MRLRVVYEEEGGSRLRMQKVGGRLEKPMAHPAEVQIIIVSIIFIISVVVKIIYDHDHHSHIISRGIKAFFGI